MTLTAHMKHLLLAGLAALVLIIGLWKLTAWQEGQAHDQKVLAEEKLKNDLAIAKEQAVVSATAQTNFDQKLSASNALVQQLNAEVQKLRSDLATRQQQDAALAPDALAGRWQALVQKGVIQSVPQGLLADLPAAHETVSQLESVPVLTAENGKLRSDSLGKDSVITAAQTLITAKGAELGACQQTIRDSELVCTAKLKEQAEKARKRSIVFSVVSFIGGVLLGHKF